MIPDSEVPFARQWGIRVEIEDDAARALASQSGIPRRNLTPLDRHERYAHNDPASASPKNDFLARLVPFLERISGR
jgi:hypothetical protein